MFSLQGRAREWLQEHGSGFWRDDPDQFSFWDEDAALEALCKHLDLDPDDPSAVDEVFPVIASYAESYT